MIDQVLADRYRIQERIATSPNGEVYRGVDLTSARSVAIKLLRPRFLVGDKFGARLRQEFRVLDSLVHPNIVTVLDTGVTSENLHYLVMEFVPGISLARVIELEGPLLPTRVVGILEQLASALDVAHSRQIIHRDIQPSNIMILAQTGRDIVKLLDFGLAKVLDKERMASSISATGTGVILGNTTYISPEGAMGKPLDRLADIYSLGTTVYTMLTGRPPFEAQRSDQMYDVLLAHVRETPPRLNVKNPRVFVPEAIEQVVLSALAKKPTDRPPTAVDFALQFRQAVQSTSHESQRGRSEKPATQPMRSATPKSTLREAVGRGSIRVEGEGGSGIRKRPSGIYKAPSGTWPGPNTTNSPTPMRPAGRGALDPVPIALSNRRQTAVYNVIVSLFLVSTIFGVVVLVVWLAIWR